MLLSKERQQDINHRVLKIPFHWFPLQNALRWRHNDHAGVSNHQPRGCLLNRLFRRKSKKTSKLRVTGLCAGNSPGTGEFPAQMASYAENVSIWWRHHGSISLKGSQQTHGQAFVCPLWVQYIVWHVVLLSQSRDTRCRVILDYASCRMCIIEPAWHGNVSTSLGPH